MDTKKHTYNGQSYIPSYEEYEIDGDMDDLELVSAFHICKIYAGNFRVRNSHNLKNW